VGKLAPTIVVSGLVVSASALSLTAADAGTVAPRIVYRSVHLANPQRPPELYSVLSSGLGRRLLVRGLVARS
jgi:hypothetical protein